MGLLAVIRTIHNANKKATTLIQTASINKENCNVALELPSTFCVLILFIRIGVKAVLKLVKLIPVDYGRYVHVFAK